MYQSGVFSYCFSLTMIESIFSELSIINFAHFSMDLGFSLPILDCTCLSAHVHPFKM